MAPQHTGRPPSFCSCRLRSPAPIFGNKARTTDFWASFFYKCFFFVVVERGDIRFFEIVNSEKKNKYKKKKKKSKKKKKPNTVNTIPLST